MRILSYTGLFSIDIYINPYNYIKKKYMIRLLFISAIIAQNPLHGETYLPEFLDFFVVWSFTCRTGAPIKTWGHLNGSIYTLSLIAAPIGIR